MKLPEKRRGLASISRDRWTILFLLIFAAGLRIYRLNQGLWYDELFSWKEYFSMDWAYLLTRMPTPNNHPLYSILAKISIAIFGKKEWAARLPAYLFGSLTPPLLFLAGKRWLGYRTGLLAGILMSIAPGALWFSQDARGYSAMIFFTLLAAYEFGRLSERISGGRVTLYLFAAVAAIYSHLYSAPVIAAHLAVAVVMARRGETKNVAPKLAALSLIALVLGALLYSPMWRALQFYAGTTGHQTRGRELSWAFLADLFLSWSAGEDHPLWSLIVILPALVGFLVMFQNRRWLAGIWLVALAGGLTVPLVTSTFVYQRFYAYAMPGFYLMTAAGVELAASRLRPWPRLARLVLPLPIILVIGSGLIRYYRYDKQALRPAADWLYQNINPRDKVFTLDILSDVFYQYYRETQTPGPKIKLKPWMLSNAYAVTGDLGFLDEPFSLALQQNCFLLISFPSSGPRENVINIYRCGLISPTED